MTITKGILIDNALRLIDGDCVENLSIRALAKFTDCSTGAIYYHFKTKNELMIGLYEYYWTQSFISDIKDAKFIGSFIDYIDFYYEKESKRDEYCIGKLMRGIHKLTNDEIEKFKEIEMKLRGNLLDKFIEILDNDGAFGYFHWSEHLSKESFCSFVIENIETALLLKKPDCAALKAILTRLMSYSPKN